MLCPESLAASITAVATILAEDRDTDDVDLLAAIFTQLGDTLATLSTARQICENKKSKALTGKASETKAIGAAPESDPASKTAEGDAT